MQPPHLISLLPLLLLGASPSLAAEEAPEPTFLPCTTKSSSSGNFYDLRPISVALIDPSKKLGSSKTDSWHAKGHDYPGNFTLNICAPVVEELGKNNLPDVVGVDKDLWRNVSAYYEVDGKAFSIGQESSAIKFRGRKLILQYTDGSPCGPSIKKRSPFHAYEEAGFDPEVPTLPSSYDSSTDAEREKDSDKEKEKAPLMRKSTLISFHCEKDPTAPLAVASFAGTDPYECAYFFEVRSRHACPAAEPTETGLGPGGVFGVIVGIAVLVYFVGGIMYQRSVAHARGWRQLPNYAIWAGLGGFFADMFIILTSSCARCLPGRRGYRSLSVSANGNPPRGRTGRPDDENRLIDQLDEEWDD